MNGRVKTVMRDRGFGFVVGEDSRDYFFSYADVVGVTIDALEVNAAVRFEPTETARGPRAQIVELA